MKKRVLIIVCLVAIAIVGTIALKACPASKTDSTSTDSQKKVDMTSQTVEVTFPRVYFQDLKTSDDAAQVLDDLGCTDIKANEDGSYTASLPKDSYSTLVKSEYDKAKESIEGLKNASRFPNIATVTCDDNLTAVKITLKTDQPGLADTYAPAEAGNAAIVYQTIAGLDAKCTVTLVGASGATLSERVFQE